MGHVLAESGSATSGWIQCPPRSSGLQLWQRPASSFQQLVQVYCRQSMQKLNEEWKASSCRDASTSASERMASLTESDRESWLMM